MTTFRSIDPAQLLSALKQALGRRRRVEIDMLIGQLVAISAPLGTQWRGLFEISRRNGALANARAALDLYVAQSANSPLSLFHKVAMLSELGDLNSAVETLARLPADFPDIATNAHLAGTLALNLGNLDGARRHFTTALSDRPTSGQTWLSFSDVMRTEEAGRWAPMVLAAQSRMEQAVDTERAPYLYALGAALEAMGEHDDAFEAFAKGASLVRAARPYDMAADRRGADEARDIAAPRESPTLSTRRPIFVFGPPRSGTTLIEQILTSHSAVTDGGEIQLFDVIAQDIGGLSRRHLEAALRTTNLDTLASAYLKLLDARFGPEGRVIDKTLNATRYAGLIATILPEAPLVWIRRDPLDNAWSCYRTFFNQGVTWSWDQKALAAHLLLEAEMLAFWRDLLGSRLLVLDYEALVSAPETMIPTLLAHCGLSAEPSVFAPHKTERAVITASVTQVRQPISRRAVGAAARYRRHLEPFIQAFGYAG